MNGSSRRPGRTIGALVLCGLLLAAVLSVLGLLSGAVMSLLGFQCRSVGSLLLFFIAAAILSYPLGLIAGALPKALLSRRRASPPAAAVLYVCLDTCGSYLGFRIIDVLMPSVWASDRAILAVSLIFALLGAGELFKPPQP